MKKDFGSVLIFSFIAVSFLLPLVAYAASLDAAESPAASEKFSVKPDASLCRDKIMQAAGASSGKPYILELDDFLLIGNDRIGLALYRESRAFALCAIVDVAGGGTLMAVGPGPLWKATLADPARKTISLTSDDSEENRFLVRRSDGKVVLELRWMNISSAEEKRILSAAATISAEPNSPYLRWNISLEDRSLKRGLWEVDFPNLHCLVPTAEPSETRLLLTWGQGRVVSNPFGRDEKFVGQYPAPSAPMQFSALYSPAGGLFLATHDGRMYIKQFIHESRKKERAITFYLRNFPENRGDPGVDFKMPYDFVMTTFKGDWFTASRLYRQWAIKQVWCAKGPLYQREDVPDWYKRLTFWSLAWEQKSYANWETLKEKIGDKDQTLEDIRRISKIIGVPYAVHFYGWHKGRFDEAYPEYFPPLLGDEGFKKQVSAIHEAGARIVPYVNGCLWGKHLASYKRLNVVKYCIKDEYGNSYNWRIDHTAAYEKGLSKKAIYWLDWPCPYTKFWQNKMKEVSLKLVRDYGVDGVYYDVLSGNAHQCFDPHHGHTKGGGNYWAVGNRELLRLSREVIRKANPEAIMTSEQPSEVYIDRLDSMLLFNVQRMPGAVPAFQAVYHDYFILFGNATYAPGVLDCLPMPVGESFVNGDQLGWFNIWPMFFESHPREELSIYWRDQARRKRYIEFVVRIARIRHNAGFKFLVLGEMLEPLEIQNKLPEVRGNWGPAGRGFRVMPAVIHSVWRAPDGTIGLVFCNISKSDQEVSYRFDGVRYNLPEGKKYVVTNLGVEGERVLGRYDSPVFTRKEEIASMDGLIVEIRPE